MCKFQFIKGLTLTILLTININFIHANDNRKPPAIKENNVSFLLNPLPLASIAFKGFGIGQEFEYSYKSVSFSLDVSFIALPYYEPYCSGNVVLFSSEIGFRWYCFKSASRGLFFGAQSGIKLLYLDGNSFLATKKSWVLSPTLGISAGYRFNFTPKRRVQFVLDVGLLGEFFLSGRMGISGEYEYNGVVNKYYLALFPLLKSGIMF